MKLRSAFLFLFAAAAVSLLLSCQADGGSIYATIESEQKATANTLPTYMTVADIVVPSSGTYYVAAGGIFQGVLSPSSNNVTWTPNNTGVTNPSYPFNPTFGGVSTTTVSPYDLCNALAYFDNRLWGGFFTQSDDTATSSNNVGLMESDANLSFAGQQPVASAAGQQVTLLRAEGTYLFMSTATPFDSAHPLIVPKYSLSYYDGTTWTTIPNLTDLTYPVIGMAYDGTNYWAVSTNVIYKGATPATLAALSSAPPLASVTGQPTDGYNDVSADPVTHTVFVPTVRDGIYVSKDSGSSWIAHTTASVSGTIPVSFLTVAGPLDAANNVYLAGTDGYGYYVFTLNATAPNDLVRQTSTTILLYGESVSKIVIDGSNVLMGTNENGVWRSQFGTDGNLASGASWTHESGGSTTTTL